MCPPPPPPQHLGAPLSPVGILLIQMHYLHNSIHSESGLSPGIDGFHVTSNDDVCFDFF